MKNLIAIIFLLPAGIFNLQITDTTGDTVSLSQYQNKKLLLVNIATGSIRVNQLSELQQLQLQYGDSVQVIAFPTNSFGHEEKADQQINDYCHTQYNTTFLLAAKTPVTGESSTPVYQWLADSSANGAMSWTPTGDFCKILISPQGQIVGAFAPAVSPMDTLIINAIQSNY